jgi:CDP-glucose 4,6-dehydratase
MDNWHFWRGKKVLVTGHTGFKGAWLSLWLHSLGADVTGFALAPPTDPSLFVLARLDELITSVHGDVRDLSVLQTAMNAAQPEIVFHLAAQSLVRESYQSPVETYATNVMGTVHLLEAVRVCSSIKAVVNVTTDKCYENREWHWGYREHEPLGGHDPYSSSKGCSELVTAAYRQSFLSGQGTAVASARAGNVIGGGDWATDRLIPDFLRAIDAGEVLNIRSPQAIRPWQHVLEPLSGYLMLAERLFRDGGEFAEAWNFGPVDDDAKTVAWILEALKKKRPAVSWQCSAQPQPHEAGYLKLDSSKSRKRLGWSTHWSLETALGKILDWHEEWRKGADVRAVTLQQINTYQQLTTKD